MLGVDHDLDRVLRMCWFFRYPTSEGTTANGESAVFVWFGLVRFGFCLFWFVVLSVLLPRFLVVLFVCFCICTFTYCVFYIFFLFCVCLIGYLCVWCVCVVFVALFFVYQVVNVF